MPAPARSPTSSRSTCTSGAARRRRCSYWRGCWRCCRRRRGGCRRARRGGELLQVRRGHVALGCSGCEGDDLLPVLLRPSVVLAEVSNVAALQQGIDVL